VFTAGGELELSMVLLFRSFFLFDRMEQVEDT